MRKKAYLVLVPAAVLIVLGGLNIYKKIIWRQPSDGVIWDQKPAGLTAVEVELDSPAYLAGIKKGDVLYTINGIEVTNKIDVAKNLWIAASSDQRVKYQIFREGEVIPFFPPLYSLSKKGPNLIYFFLTLIGLTTLVIGVIIFLSSKRPFSLPYSSLLLLSSAFYALYIFSPTGELNTLDSVFYWLDKIAFLVFPPFLLHFFLIFPKRKKNIRKSLSSVYILYLPALVLFLITVFIHLPNTLKLSEALILHFFQVAEKIELVHFILFSLVTFGVVLRDVRASTNPVIKKQLKWIANGLGVAILPFSAVYLIPFLFDYAPSPFMELTVILQAFLPLTFAYSISRYRLVDLEVVLKKAVILFFSYVVIAILYVVVSSQTRIFSEYRLNAVMLGILAIVLSATLFTPLKKLFQSLLDRVIYRRSYHYRRTLLSISQELGRERNLQKLSQALLELTANALSLKSIALLLPAENTAQTFFVFRSIGDIPSRPKRIIISDRLYRYLLDENFLSVHSLAEKKDLKPDFRDFYTLGFLHLMPLKVEDKLIGCLGMGRKLDDSYLGTEDWELLRTISSSVALALENAYLYNQAQIRALELERLKDYSENIIESLTVGVAVIDRSGKVIGWNRILEETFGMTKEEVFQKRLSDVIGAKNFSALFPSDTQQDYRLLSEISIAMPRGGVKIFDIAKTPLLDNLMNPYGTIVVFEDITEKVSLQQQLLTAEKLASIGLLSAGVAHEINTPLTGISSYIQILQKKLPSPRYAQILDKIETQAERVGKIVKNLLNFARNPSDSAFYHVDLKESLQAIISLIDYKLKNMNIRLQLDLNPVKLIWAQGERLQQVFINIILNALDAMPEGGTLTIALSATDSQALVRIEDTGTGIKDQHLPHIFDPFFTTKGIGKGTGLGLSISYAIVKEHEGTINVESESGKGSVFTIALPTHLDKRALKRTSAP